MAPATQAREEWRSRTGFLMAAIGSAVGLGNIWRFPYVAYENGGGAFFVPYLVALLTAGLPLLILEYALGHRFRGSAPLTFRRLSPRTEFLGWWQVAVAFVISTYYPVVIAWAASYAWFSLRLQWGDDPAAFFESTFTQAAQPGTIGGLVPGVALPLVGVWLVTLGVLYAGVRKGIEGASRIGIPLLLVMFLVVVLRGVTLPGAIVGLDAFFTPDFSGLTAGRVWVAAYGQIFFSLSVGFAIMVTYASYLPRRSDLTNSALIAGFANSSFELLAGIGVFSALGFLATSQGISVADVATQGVGLAFVVFPQIISTLPGLNALFGVLFFGALMVAGLTSQISIVETYVSACSDKFDIDRGRAVLLGGGLAALASLLFATHGGVPLLDTVDYFINQFGVAVVGLVEVVMIAWVLRALARLRRHANAVSDVRVGTGWTVALAAVTPVLLGYQLALTLRTTIVEGYSGYPPQFLLVAGWAVAAAALVLGLLLALRPWNELLVDPTAHEEAADRTLHEAITSRQPGGRA